MVKRLKMLNFLKMIFSNIRSYDIDIMILIFPFNLGRVSIEYETLSLTAFTKSTNENTRVCWKICSRLRIKTPEERIDVILFSLLFFLNWFHILLSWAHCRLWRIKIPGSLAMVSKNKTADYDKAFF